MVFYGILDVLAKPVFCFIHLFLMSSLDLNALQLQSGKFSSYANNVAAYDREKHSHSDSNGGSSHHHHHHHQAEPVPVVTEAPPVIVDNEPRTGTTTYSPKAGRFSRNSRRSERAAGERSGTAAGERSATAASVRPATAASVRPGTATSIRPGDAASNGVTREVDSTAT